MQKIKAFGDWLTKWFTVIVIVWAVFNYFVPQTSLWGKSYTGYFLGIVLFGNSGRLLPVRHLIQRDELSEPWRRGA